MIPGQDNKAWDFNNFDSWDSRNESHNYWSEQPDTGTPIWRIPLPEDNHSPWEARRIQQPTITTVSSVCFGEKQRGEWKKTKIPSREVNQIIFELEIPGFARKDFAYLKIEEDKIIIRAKSSRGEIKESISVQFWDEIDFLIKPETTIENGLLIIKFETKENKVIDLL